MLWMFLFAHERVILCQRNGIFSSAHHCTSSALIFSLSSFIHQNIHLQMFLVFFLDLNIFSVASQQKTPLNSKVMQSIKKTSKYFIILCVHACFWMCFRLFYAVGNAAQLDFWQQYHSFIIPE